jgi:hypothetical protein
LFYVYSRAEFQSYEEAASIAAVMAMTSSSVLAWQVDIAGLSQLIFNLGSHGLKQLAMAGVDLHFIGCMLMIAEFTPASPDF